MKKSIVLKFFLQKKNDIHYAREILITSWPREIETLRCRLPGDSEIYTFDDLNNKFKNKIFNVKNPFCIILFNSESKAEEKFCVKLNKDLPMYEDIIREKKLGFDVSNQLEKLGY
ncbi:MAG: hypothetical protein GF421_02455 [Candidatus Aminicenantes bacterium]|nr:hypothetical protein [Candidatus Aminicenantes bacterium]